MTNIRVAVCLVTLLFCFHTTLAQQPRVSNFTPWDKGRVNDIELLNDSTLVVIGYAYEGSSTHGLVGFVDVDLNIQSLFYDGYLFNTRFGTGFIEQDTVVAF